jgi:flagellar hook-associated protein 1
MFDSLHLGARGVMSSQLALNVTGQNITNANTEGYSRKRLNLLPDFTPHGSFGEMGVGVDVDRIERIRDQFIDAQLNAAISKQSYLEEKDASLMRVENMFNEPSDTGLNNTLNEFWNSWQDVANNPGDLSAREALRSNSQRLTGTMHTLSGQIRDYKLTMNDHLENLVGQVNKLTAEIASLNKSIVLAESGTQGEANDSRDRRDQLVGELSQYTELGIFENELGAITITTGGNIIVSPESHYELEVVRETVIEDDGFNFSKVTIKHSINQDDFDALSGRLASVMEIRDEILPKYTDHLNQIAKSLVENINNQHRQGFSLQEDTGIHFFNPEKLQASNIELSRAIKSSSLNIAAATGTLVAQANENFNPATDGLIIAAPADEWRIDLRGVNGKYNDILQDSMRIIIDTDGNMATTDDQVELQEGINKDYVVDYQNGFVRFFNHSVRFNPGDTVNINFEYQDQAFSGVGDGENALKIGQLREGMITKPDVYGNNTQTIGEFYASMIGNLGVERNEVSSALETQTFIREQLYNEQQQVSGVSLDEEMVNMIKFENAYQASAKFISSIDRMLEILMNL